jgi:GntR family transcriptional repressor for pyruvate dehydrogenase complex
MVGTVKRTSLIKGVVDEIKAKIVQGEYAEGQLLPPQDAMAKSLGISRATLREAINQLATVGLVDVVHGVGCYIRRPNASEFFDYFSSIVVMDTESAEELLQARSIIEPAVTALAAENADDEEIAALGELIEVMEHGRHQVHTAEYRALDLQFHMRIAQCSHNQILVPVVRAVRELLPDSIYQSFWQSDHLVDSALYYHRKIYEAIAGHDPRKARTFMDEHLATVRELHTQLK